MEIQTFQHAKIYSSKKNPLKQTKIPQAGRTEERNPVLGVINYPHLLP
jgi:hypothetical protein